MVVERTRTIINRPDQARLRQLQIIARVSLYGDAKAEADLLEDEDPGPEPRVELGTQPCEREVLYVSTVLANPLTCLFCVVVAGLQQKAEASRRRSVNEFGQEKVSLGPD